MRVTLRTRKHCLCASSSGVRVVTCCPHPSSYQGVRRPKLARGAKAATSFPNVVVSNTTIPSRPNQRIRYATVGVGAMTAVQIAAPSHTLRGKQATENGDALRRKSSNIFGFGEIRDWCG